MKKTVLFLMTLVMSVGFAFAQIDFEDRTLGEVFPSMGWGGQVATIVEDPAGVNGLSLQLSSTNYNTAVRINEVTFYGGYTLADVAKMQADINRISGDVNWKNIQFWFGAVGAAFSNGTAMGSTSNNPIQGQPLGTWVKLTFTPADMGLSGALLALSTFDMAIGMNAAANVIIWDNITFFDADGNVIPTQEPPIVVEPLILDFESFEIGTIFNTISQDSPAPTAVVEADPLGENGQSLRLVASSWNTYIEVPTITLADGYTLADVAKMAFNIQFMNGSGQNNFKTVLVMLGAEGATLNYNTPAISASNLIGNSEAINTWLAKEISFASLTNTDLLALNTFSMAMGFNHNNLDYFLDNIKFFDADGNVISAEATAPVIVIPEPEGPFEFNFEENELGDTYPVFRFINGGKGGVETAGEATVVANPAGEGQSLYYKVSAYDQMIHFGTINAPEGLTLGDLKYIDFDIIATGQHKEVLVKLGAPANLDDATDPNNLIWGTDDYKVLSPSATAWGSVSIDIVGKTITYFNGVPVPFKTSNKGANPILGADESLTSFDFYLGANDTSMEYYLDNIILSFDTKNGDVIQVKPAILSAYGVVGAIQANAEGASIYDISGRLVTKAVVGTNAVPAGLYIVKVGNQAVKVVVQ